MATSTKNEVTPETYRNGAVVMAPYIVGGLVLLNAVYWTLFLAFRTSITDILPPPHDDFCVDLGDAEVCSRSDLFAFQMTSCLAIALCGATGFYCWHVSKRVHTLLPSTPAGRLFGYLPEAEWLATINFTFQTFDFFISLLIPEHATAIMLTHHLMAATVSWCSIRYQVLHYYGIFFLGLSEVSSIFLVFVDLSKYFPPTPGSAYDQWVGLVCGPLFVVSFAVYRVVLWWPVSYRLFRDVYEVVHNGQASKLRPGKSWVLYVFLALNLPLGILQLYWFTIIIEEVLKVLGSA